MQITLSSSSSNLRLFMKFISLENKIDFLSDTNPIFIGAVYEFSYLLMYLHYRNIKKEKIHERTQMVRQMAGLKSKSNNSFTTESELWRNAGPSAFQFQESVLTKYDVDIL